MFVDDDPVTLGALPDSTGYLEAIGLHSELPRWIDAVDQMRSAP